MSDLISSEHFEQRSFVMWFKQTYPSIRIFAIPNGGARNINTARKLKCEGVSAGIPDLFIPAWHLWIEIKRVKGGRLSPEQKDWIEYLESVGYRVIVGYGALDAQEKIIKSNFFN